MVRRTNARPVGRDNYNNNYNVNGNYNNRASRGIGFSERFGDFQITMKTYKHLYKELCTIEHLQNAYVNANLINVAPKVGGLLRIASKQSIQHG